MVLRDTFSGWTPNITYFRVSMGSQVTLALLPGPSGLPCLSKGPGSETPGACLQGVSYLSWRSERCDLCKDTHRWSRGAGIGPEPHTPGWISGLFLPLCSAHRRIEKLGPGSGHQAELYTWKRFPLYLLSHLFKKVFGVHRQGPDRGVLRTGINSHTQYRSWVIIITNAYKMDSSIMCYELL